MQDLIRLVEFDIRGENKVNYFTKEEIELQDKTCNFIIPNASPFFGEPENFKLYNAKGGELKIGKDYSLVGEFIPFCDVSGRSVVTFIELSDEVLKNNSKVFVTYISIGAYFIPRGELEKWKDALHTGKIPIDFEEKVHSIPEVLPPSHHLHNVREEITNWYDITYFFHNLYGLVKGKDRNILATIDRDIDKAFELMKTYRVNEQAKLTKHDKDYNNPHGTSAKDIDLGNVPNIGVASPEEILSGKGDGKFLTSESVELLLNGEVEENKDLMLPGVYPISRFGTGGYIPPSISGSFEGLGHENFTFACLEENDGLTVLAPRFDGKNRGLYYFKAESNGVLTPTYHKYEHPFFRSNGVIPSAVYNTSGKEVVMIHDRNGGRKVIGGIGGTLNPEGHVWSFLTTPWGVSTGTSSTAKLGKWVYVFHAVDRSGAGTEGTINYRICRFLFDRIGKDLNIVAEVVEGLTYTNADGERKTQTKELELFKNIPATTTTSKQCFFNFVGVLPRNVNMNTYTSGVLKKDLGGGRHHLRFLVSFWIESVAGSVVGTIEIVYEHNPDNPKNFELKGHSPKFDLIDGRGFTGQPPHSPSLGWMYYVGTNQGFWFDEEKDTVIMGSSRGTVYKSVALKDFFNKWYGVNTTDRMIKQPLVSLSNPLGFKPTLGSGVWGNGFVTFLSLKDVSAQTIRNGFSYKEGFKVRPEVYNESVKDLYSIPLPDKIKPLVLENVPYRLFSNIAPLSEHTTNNKGVPSFGKMFASSNYVLAKGNFTLTLPTKTSITETEDSVIVKGSVDRIYTQAALEVFLKQHKGPKPSWKDYPETYVTIYEADGEIAEGKGEVAKVPFITLVESYDGTDGISTVVLFTIDKNKLTINPTDVKIVKVFDFVIPHSKSQVGGINSNHKATQPIYIKVSAKNNGSCVIMLPGTQSKRTTGNGGFDGVLIHCVDANTTNPNWGRESASFWGLSGVFHGDIGRGLSPSENMTGMSSFRGRDVTGGCSVMIDNFLFASTYPQEGWIVYFPSEQDVLINGSSYRLPIGSIDLRDSIPDPKDKTIYIYVTVEGNKPFYYASLVEGARSVYHLLVAVVKTSKTKIESIERYQPIHIGDRKISKFREGAILPVSTGFPQDDGWFDHLDGEDLGIAKPGPDMSVPTGPVTQFEWRQEHGNVGQYSWTNPVLDYSVDAYVKAGYFEDDVQHYLKQGYDLSKYRLVISEWFTYVGQSGEPNNKTTHPLMTFVHDDVKKRFKTGFVKPRTDYVNSKYLHIMDTYLPTRIERKDKSELGITVPHRIIDSAVKAKVSDYENQTGIGPIANNFGEYFGVESKSLKPTDWWSNGVDFDFNRVVINLLPFNSGGNGLNRENEFTQEYIPLRTKLEKENKYLHEFYFKPQIPFQTPSASKTVGMFAATNTQRYIDSPAPAPSGKALPSIIVKPGNGLLSRGVSKADLEKNIRGSWWEPILNNSITDDRKFYDGKGYNPNTHDLHYYIWEDVTWNGSNTRDMYNHINSRKGKDRIRVDVNHFRQAQRYFATIVSLPKGHKFTSPTPLYRVTGGDLGNADEFNTFLGHLKLGNLNSNWGEIFLNEINHLNKANMNGGDDKFITITPWLIVGRVGGGSLAEQRARAFNERYVPKRNELLAARHYVIEHWLENEITWKGQVVGGVLIAVTLVNPPVSNLSFNVEIRAGNTGSSRDRVTGGLPDTVEQMYTKYTNLLASYDTMSTKDITTLVNNPATRYWDYMEVGKTLLEWRRRGMNKNTHKVRVTLWSEPYTELYPNSPNGRPSMRNEVVNNRKYDYVAPLVNDPAGVPDVTTRPRSSLFVSYKFIGINTARAADIPYELHNGDVGTTDEINSLFSRMKLGSLAAGWGELFLDPSRQLKPVDWYNGGINWAHYKLIIKVWTLSDHSGGAQLNGRSTGHTSLYVSKRDRLKREHAYAFEHWFDRDTTFKGRSVAGLFLTAHTERTAEPPRIVRHQFWYGSRYHKGHVDSCVNKNVVSSYGFDSFPSCRVNVGLEPDSPRPHRYAMAGLISIPDNCHIVSMYQTNGVPWLNWQYKNNYVAPGTRNVEILECGGGGGAVLTIVIGNEIGETITYKLNLG